jgi:hypothetical protein
MTFRLLALLLLLPLAATHAAEKTSITIKKCKDAAGKWHYGDSAADECAKSKVTEISKEGITKKVIAAPLTEEELKRKAEMKDEDERKRHDLEDRKRSDQILLSTYAHEQDILFVRDRKIAQIDASINSSTETLKPLRKTLERLETQAADEVKNGKPTDQTAKGIETTKAQIAKHEALIAAKRQEQDKVRKQMDADLARYRELKKGPTGKETAAADAKKAGTR